MNRPAVESSVTQAARQLESDEPAASVSKITGLRRNFSLIAVYQVVVRTGWIFKTESIIMPAVLDVLGGSAWLRGCLPG